MKIAIAADHAGLVLKDRLKERLMQGGHEVEDLGTNTSAPCDYPDYAAAVGREVAQGRAERGVLVCCSGMGMSIAANKIPGIRAALGVTQDGVVLARAHNNANVITFGAKFTSEDDAAAMLETFLGTAFDGGRHEPRLAKIAALERDALSGGKRNNG